MGGSFLRETDHCVLDSLAISQLLLLAERYLECVCVSSKASFQRFFHSGMYSSYVVCYAQLCFVVCEDVLCVCVGNSSVSMKSRKEAATFPTPSI